MKPCALLLSLLLMLVGCPVWAEGELVTGPDRRQEIEWHIEMLDEDRAEISTKGPRTATLIGLGTMLLGGIPLAVGLTADDPWGDDYARRTGGIISGATLIGIGTVMAITAGLVWNDRIYQRHAIDAKRESLIEERDGLAATLSRLELRSPHRDGTQFVTLGIRF